MQAWGIGSSTHGERRSMCERGSCTAMRLRTKMIRLRCTHTLARLLRRLHVVTEQGKHGWNVIRNHVHCFPRQPTLQVDLHGIRTPVATTMTIVSEAPESRYRRVCTHRVVPSLAASSCNTLRTPARTKPGCAGTWPSGAEKWTNATPTRCPCLSDSGIRWAS